MKRMLSLLIAVMLVLSMAAVIPVGAVAESPSQPLYSPSGAPAEVPTEAATEAETIAETIAPTEPPYEPTEAPTVAPTVAPTEMLISPSEAPHYFDPTSYIYINADGNIYEVEAGSDHTYTYYLQDTKKVCSLDAETKWDAPEISRITDPIFPLLGDTIFNPTDLVDSNGSLTGQKIGYNYTRVVGADFSNHDSRLVTFLFHVDENTAPGIYSITTVIKTLGVGGESLERQIFVDTVLTPDEIPYREGVLDGEIPVRRYDDPMEYTADEQTYVLESGLEKTFTAKAGIDYLDKGTYNKFQYITVDGLLVSYRNYAKESGSLRLTFKPAYMNTLAVGDHTVRFVFPDGEAIGILHIVQQNEVIPTESGNTGPYSPPAHGAGSTITYDNSVTNWAGPIIFYVYDPETGDALVTWGSKNKGGGTDNGDGTWSKDLSDYGLQDGRQYCIIFYDCTTGMQTYDLMMDTSCYGDTAKATGNSIENPVDSNKIAKETRWSRNKLGPRLQITSLGNVIGETVPNFTSKYQLFVDFLASRGSVGMTNALRLNGKTAQAAIDYTAGKLSLTTSDVTKAIAQAKTTGDRVDWSGRWNASKSTLPGGSGQVSKTYPKISISNAADGVKLSWTNTGAAKYRIFYKAGSSWTRMIDVEGLSFIDEDVMSCQTYTYTVRAISNDGSQYLSNYDPVGAKITYVAAPVFNLSNAEDGVKISWNKSAGSAKFRVFRSGSNGWTKLADTAATSYIDKAVNSGTSYTYTVRCLNSAGTAFTSGFRAGKAIRFIATPVFSLSNAVNGVTVSWNKVGGAAKFRVFRSGSNGWTKLADTAGTSFVDTGVSANGTYTYTVRCLNDTATAYTSAYRAGKSIKFYAAPRITLSNTANGISVKWNASAGVSKYRLFYKYNNAWTKIGDTASTAYVHQNVSSGVTYTYTVRALDAKGNYLSGFYPNGFSIRYISAPDVTLSNVENGVKVSWNKPAGSQKFRVYKKNAAGSLAFLADTVNNYYVDTNVASNCTYTYTVRCINENATAFTSYFKDGKSIRFYAAPRITLRNTANGISVKWNAIAGASKYRLFYKNGSAWTKIGDTAGTSYLDRNVTNGKAKSYTVRALDAKGNYLSGFYTGGFTITYRK